MSIMLDTYLGLYFQAQNKLLIVSLKGIIMIGTQEQKVPEGESIHNDTENYNNMVPAK